MTQTLIDAPTLAARLASHDGPEPVLLDCRAELSDPSAGRLAWEAGHLPGAHHADLERDLSGALDGRNGRHPLPQRRAFAAALGRWGIGADSDVVAYDAHGGVYASRAWWLLRWLGHERVTVLDGGLDAWLRHGGTLDISAPPPAAARAYPDRAASMPTLDTAALRASLGRERLIDARAPERFRGDVEPLDRVAGHIPGALNRCFRDNLGADGRFKDAATLRAEFAPLVAGAATVVQLCGSGVTACHNLLAMTHAGLGDSVLYPGSWSEWCADASRPVATGD